MLDFYSRNRYKNMNEHIILHTKYVNNFEGSSTVSCLLLSKNFNITYTSSIIEPCPLISLLPNNKNKYKKQKKTQTTKTYQENNITFPPPGYGFIIFNLTNLGGNSFHFLISKSIKTISTS